MIRSLMGLALGAVLVSTASAESPVHSSHTQADAGRLHQVAQASMPMMSADMQRCIENCNRCHALCQEMIQHCLELGGKHATPAHIRLLQDCAEICQTNVDFMLRMSEFHPELCGVCADVCTRCAEQCERIGQGDDMMKRCAEACRASAKTCREMSKHKM